MKLYKKIFLSFILFFIFASQSFAAEINFSSDKSSGSTDDVFQIHLSVDGEVDGGQIGIKGLENFEVVGQQFSSQVEIINGDATSVREKILSIRPIKEGNFTLTAMAKEEGKEIRSKPISFSVSKSIIQQTKEDLLKNSQEETQGNSESVSGISNLKVNNSKEQQSDIAKNLLTSPTNTVSSNEENKLSQDLQPPEIKNFPKIEHISAFNGVFWLQFLGIILLLVTIFILAQKKLKQFISTFSGTGN